MMQQMLFGGYGVTAVLPSLIEVSDYKYSPATASASFTMNAAGTYSASDPGVSGNWAIGGGAPDYQFRLTTSSGTFNGASTEIWVGPSASPTWTVNRASKGFNEAIGILEIRSNATAEILATTTLSLYAEVYGGP